MSTVHPGHILVLTRQDWGPLAKAHHARVDALTRNHLDRRARGVTHAVEDFVWVYYRHRPAQLRRRLISACDTLTAAGKDSLGATRQRASARPPGP